MSWIASRRYVVVDVSAGPCDYGAVAGVGELTLPKLQALKEPPRASTVFSVNEYAAHRRAEATAVVASVIVSAMQVTARPFRLRVPLPFLA